MPGLLLLVAWLASVVLAWRQRSQRLLALDGVLLAALLLGWVSISRIYGEVWTYLLLWSWGIAMLLIVATVWSVLTWWSDSSPRPARLAFAGLAAAGLVAGCLAFTADNVDAEVPLPALNAVQGSLARQTVRYLDGPGAVGGGPRRPLRRVVVGSALPRHVRLRAPRRARAGRLRRRCRSLERRRRGGASSRAGGRGHRAAPGRGRARDRRLGPPARRPSHRLRRPSSTGAGARVRAAARRGPRSSADRSTCPELEQFEAQLFATANRTDLPATIASRVIRMAEIGLPAAVFVSVP